jgi:hypothetical protein
VVLVIHSLAIMQHTGDGGSELKNITAHIDFFNRQFGKFCVLM